MLNWEFGELDVRVQVKVDSIACGGHKSTEERRIFCRLELSRHRGM